ncbi:SCP-like extracellular [Paenibacillus sp. PR3]|uniref:SCP-like extracellular n=1 Tax=Paenibacillus terricola TaxID=2763503 RepID=A0ABR8MW66_9BACL|nr:CAP domain-containing protein [Paenibacillus terricola]MBD3920210.1 SCP-like extracellular [Paenibacillus terricola]
MNKQYIRKTVVGAVIAGMAFAGIGAASGQASAATINPSQFQTIVVSNSSELSKLASQYGITIDWNSIWNQIGNGTVTVTKPSTGTGSGTTTTTKPSTGTGTGSGTTTTTKPSTGTGSGTTTTTKPSTGTSTGGTGTSTGTNTSTSTYAQQVVTLVNQERAKAGLSALTTDSLLNTVAYDKAKDMAVNNYFSHTSPTYGSPFDMMTAYGVKYSYAGENIAAGQKTPQEVMNAWMNSAGHKANILSPNFKKIGVGYYNGEWVQEFTG